MKNLDDEEMLLFQSRKDKDVIAEDFTKGLIVDKDSEEKKNENQILEDEAEEELDETPIHDQYRLKIIATPHNTYFILLMSLLIGLAFCTLLSLVFPINTSSSFVDHIPTKELNLHGFRVGSDFYDGNVMTTGLNSSRYVTLNASRKGLLLNFTRNTSSGGITFNKTDLVFWIFPFEKKQVYIFHAVTNTLETHAFNLNGLDIQFHYDPIYINSSFEVFGIVYCNELILSGKRYKADGSCEFIDKKTTSFLRSQKAIKTMESQYKMFSSFGKVDSFAVSYPYVALSDDNEIRIYKIIGKHFSLIFKSVENAQKSTEKVQKAAEKANTFIWGEKIYVIDMKGNIQEFNKNRFEIDKKYKTLNELGYKIHISSNFSGIYFYECLDDECSISKETKVCDETSNDLKIDLDDDQRPIILSNSLKKVFYADSSFEISQFEEIPLFYEDADDINLITYSTQLLYLKDNELKLYDI